MAQSATSRGVRSGERDGESGQSAYCSLICACSLRCLFHDCLTGVCLVCLVSVCDRVEIYYHMGTYRQEGR